jgi:hypothetical protein
MPDKKRFINGLIVFISISAPFLLGAIRTSEINLPSLSNYSSAKVVSSCLNRDNIPDAEMGWTYVPTTANQLYSADNLQWLAGRLISAQIVDASNCPAGGLAANGYANACGMWLAQPNVIKIQNSLNQAIIDQYTSIGVPPVLLKQLIRTESQFWPSADVPGHYGLGNVTTLGAVNALKWNPDLLAIVCGSSENDCIANNVTAEMMFEKMVSTCPTCVGGINTEKTNQSVLLLSRVVMTYCQQTAQLIFNATGWRSDLVVDYPTLWKLTMMNYNSGSTCVFNTVRDAFKRTQGPIDWLNLSAVATSGQCSRGIYYANEVTANNYNFPPKK